MVNVTSVVDSWGQGSRMGVIRGNLAAWVKAHLL